jgi:putative peptide zinc metalloprotease protein
MCRLYDSRNVDPLFTRLYRGGGWLLGTRPALALLALIAVGGLVSFGYGILSGARGLERHPELASLVVPGLFGALVVHELSHGLAVKSYGHSIPSAGVGLWWLRPVAFVDTSEMWFSPRRERIMVSLAGPFSGLVLMGLLATASLLVDDLFWSTALWSLTLPVLAGVIMNLAPFLELDGYHVLCDLVDRPNLKRDALAWTAAWLRGERHTSAAGHRLYVGYTVASLLYMLLVLAGLVLVLRPIMARWLAGLLPDTVASPVAWALCGAQFLVVVGAVIEEYGAILRLIRRRTRQ